MRILGIKIDVSPQILILMAAAVFILPLRWLMAILIGAAVHEIGHLLALRLSKISVEGLSIGLSGARITTGVLSPGTELLCACAGPVAGVLLIGLGRLYPELALCAFVQSAFNLIPIMPFDGGRIFRCAVEALFPPYLCEKITRGMEITICFGIVCIGVICLLNHLFVATCFVLALVLLRAKIKIACKGEASAVQ